MRWELFAIAALGGALLVLVLGRWRRSLRARRRGARAVRGETAAAALLEDAGYAIVARQAITTWEVIVDDEAFAIELRADYIVEDDAGTRLVAEVKTGAVAPSVTTAATRRQLLEYRCAFGVDGVLLVCPERAAIHRVEFTAAEGVA